MIYKNFKYIKLTGLLSIKFVFSMWSVITFLKFDFNSLINNDLFEIWMYWKLINVKKSSEIFNNFLI